MDRFIENIRLAQDISNSVVNATDSKSYPVITGSFAVCIHEYSLTGKIPETTMFPNDIDYLIKCKGRLPPDVRHINGFSRQQSTANWSCTYKNGEKSFDINFNESPDFCLVEIFGTTLSVQKIESLLRRYENSQIFEDEDTQKSERNNARICSLRNLMSLSKMETSNTFTESEIYNSHSVKRGLFSDFDD